MSKPVNVRYHMDDDGRGYEVTVDGDDGQPIEKYWAGNHALDSQAWCPVDSDWAITPEKLRQLAKITADELAAKYGLATDRVYESEE